MKVVIVGGFLGAGKTTLLSAAARRLAAQGQRVGLVTNDQAPELVDTAILQIPGARVEEIAGSCFCCNFEGFARALDAHAAKATDVVLAEPVGSCTDLASTILRPLQKLRPEYDVAPLTVLADPERLAEALGDTASAADPDALYIYRKQIEEADRCIFAKADRLLPQERAKLRATDLAAPCRFLSAATGEGVQEWLDDVLSASTAGAKHIKVDYDRYAHGEAVLGWLNATYELADEHADAEAVVAGVVRRIHEAARKEGAEVGHVKAVAAVGGRSAVANLTALKSEVEIRILEERLPQGLLTVNARVQTTPGRLQVIAEEAIQGVGRPADIRCRALRSLMPGRPVPTHRF